MDLCAWTTTSLFNVFHSLMTYKPTLHYFLSFGWASYQILIYAVLQRNIKTAYLANNRVGQKYFKIISCRSWLFSFDKVDRLYASHITIRGISKNAWKSLLFVAFAFVKRACQNIYLACSLWFLKSLRYLWTRTYKIEKQSFIVYWL